MLRAFVLFACLGSALGCDTVDLGATPADVNACRPSQQFFATDVWPKFLSMTYNGKHCYDSRCHDGSGTGGALNLLPPASPLTFPLDSDWSRVYQNAANQTECTIPRSSKILTKPEGIITHGGGTLFPSGGTEEDTIVKWVTAP